MTGETPKVFVVDDDASVRGALAVLLGAEGLPSETFASAEAFLESADRGMRGCLLLDVRMAGMSGLELQAVLRERGLTLPVIVLTGHGDVPTAVRAMKAGAFDFLEKPFEASQLLARVQACLVADQAAAADRARREAAEAVLAQLTARELEVLEQLVAGKASKVIASALGISEKTVDVHRFNLMRKTESRSIAELVRIWLLAHPFGLG